ncbi:MAG: accessory Sec system protein Asp2 [Lachnospiraceae bacterium]|nr:accessory Sec system protein Asp2 [Lachnospiraceae bacterium]MCI9590369.1 accessory Sec system protein Asp2 [Lachnospiraceae bacterium]
METVRVLQLGTEDFSKVLQVSECAEWHYEPDFAQLPEQDFEVVILDREITGDEFDFLVRFMRAYCLFLTEKVPLKEGSRIQQLFLRKMGKRISAEELKLLLKEELPDYFPGSYGEKYQPQNLSVAQGFKGKVSWKGMESVELEGDYGNELTQIVFWRNNLPFAQDESLDFWLEYEKDDTVEISLEITLLHFTYGADPQLSNVWNFSEKELDDIVCISNKSGKRGFIFASLKAKGKGNLSVIALHDRHSRRGKGEFLPGGKRRVTSKREEIFYYFDPGNLKPPLNVYFSGYKTKQGFEGYYMMRKMQHPFLLIAEARLEGGSLYIGSEEYESALEGILREHIEKLGFRNSDVILSGLSMGTFGALYYGCKIRPNTILIGKPLASIGNMAGNERLKSPGGSHSWLDVLHKAYGSLEPDAMEQMNCRFWDMFDRTDWSKTRFAVAYMIEDELDEDAYENLQSHLKDVGARIYGKGLHGRHNDNTPGIVQWFKNQYRAIIENDFDKTGKKTGR